MTATAANILSGKTAYVAGSAITGSMTNNGAVTQTLSTTGSSYTIPAGYHNGSGKVTASITNLKAANIAKGVSVGGVTGTYDPLSNALTATVTIELLGSTTTASHLTSVCIPLADGSIYTLTANSVGVTYTVPIIFCPHWTGGRSVYCYDKDETGVFYMLSSMNTFLPYKGSAQTSTYSVVPTINGVANAATRLFIFKAGHEYRMAIGYSG